MLTTPHCKKLALLRNTNTCLGPGFILWYEESNGKGHILRKWDVGGTDWTGLAQVRGRWRAIVNAVMNLRVS